MPSTSHNNNIIELEDASPDELANLTTTITTPHPSSSPANNEERSRHKKDQKSIRKGIALGVLLSIAVFLCLYTASQRPSLMSTKALKSTTGALSSGSVDEQQDGASIDEASSTSKPPTTVPSSSSSPNQRKVFQTAELQQQSSVGGDGVGDTVNVKSLLAHSSSRSIGGCGVSASPPPPPQGGVHPPCPVFKRSEGGAAGAATTRDTEVDRSPEWVDKKYALYASQCAAKQGMMWSKLRRSTHDAMLRRVLSLAVQQDVLKLDGVAGGDGSNSSVTMLTLELPKADLQQGLQRYTQGIKGGSSKVLRVLDWGCGCGVGVDAVSRLLLSSSNINNNNNTSGDTAPLNQNSKFVMRPEVMGIDITKSAITYANEIVKGKGGEDNPLASTVQFCHADGTSLSWVPSDSYDIVLAFGSVLHVPLHVMCETVSELLRIVRVGGIVWGGYIDSKDTAARLAKCNLITPSSCTSSATPFGATVHVLKDNTWFKRLGVPSANRKRKPASLVWRKVAASPTN